jgi:hypothetical protein
MVGVVALTPVTVLIVQNNDVSLERRIDTLTQVTAGAAQFMLFVLITGTASMVILQTLKRIFFLRGRFNYYKLSTDPKQSSELDSAIRRVLKGASGRRSYVHLDIPVDQLAAQISAWVDVDLATRDELDPSARNARVAVEQQLDVLQVGLRNSWRQFLHVAASTIALILAAVTLLVFPVNAGAAVGLLVASFALGGFFAGLTRDVVALVERGRGSA